MNSAGFHFQHHSRFSRGRDRRGAIFITALGVIVILSGLVLVFAQNMRTEMLASGNRLAYAQADAVEQGAERWVLAQVESNSPDAAAITQIPAEALTIGDGYFWVLHPDSESDQQYAYGIADESAKLNLNTATADQMLNLPGMTEDVADSIVDWVDANSDSRPNGAESAYYESLPEPYDCKNAPLETIEETLLVKGVTPELLYGYDRNHDGVIDEAERTAGGTATIFNMANDTGRGLFNFVTVNTVESNAAADGTARVNVNDRNLGPLRDVLHKALPANRADQVLVRVAVVIAAAGQNQAFANLGVFYTASGMSAAEFKLVADSLTTNSATTVQGLVNVNTAPAQVLQCLPGLDQSDADALVSRRASADSSSIAWVFDALSASKAGGIAGSITSRSHQYSADIVAVSGNGRAYKRVRIVVDSQQIPAKIVYRKDLTALGWPLPAEIRAELRAGQKMRTNLQTLSLNSGGR